MTPITRVSLDSNILLSASLDSPNNFTVYWDIPRVDVLTCQYSINEVSRNLKMPEHRANLWRLMYRSHLVPDGSEVELPLFVSLPQKDEPILKSAVAARAEILVTGDRNHFGRYFGKVIQGTLILPPHRFKRRYSEYFLSGKTGA